MIEIPGNWELAKAMPSADPVKWRRQEEWNQAEAKAAELRAQGYTVTITAGMGGAPIITAVPPGGAA